MAYGAGPLNRSMDDAPRPRAAAQVCKKKHSFHLPKRKNGVSLICIFAVSSEMIIMVGMAEQYSNPI